MALRLIEMTLSREDENVFQEVMKDFKLEKFWYEHGSDNRLLIKIILQAEETEAVLDALEKQVSAREGFRAVILAVEASVPRLDSPEKDAAAQKESEPDKSTGQRIYREELYADISDLCNPSKVYILMVALSSFVATTGILRDNVAIVIGAMVIAPLLGPNVALSLATTLGDTALGYKAIKANVSGILLALVISFFLGSVLAFDPQVSEIVSRTNVGLGDIALALASGSAGALAFTSGLPSVLIGVMVAVALLPPLAVAGLLLGAGYSKAATGAFLLFFTNIICINLSGVATFLLQGIRPLTWWEASEAKKAARKAIFVWVFLLALLVILILFSKKS